MRALLVASLALSVGLSAAGAQDSTAAKAEPPKGELAGKWTSSNLAGAGTGQVKYIIMEINQRADSLWGLASVERDGMPTESNIEIAGSFRGGKIDLHDPFGNLRMNGVKRKEDMRLKIVPGRYKEAEAYEMVFRRTQ